jgi:hypothetical protein
LRRNIVVGFKGLTIIPSVCKCLDANTTPETGTGMGLMGRRWIKVLEKVIWILGRG